MSSVDAAIIRRKLARIAASLDDAKVLAAIGTLSELHPRYVQAVEEYLAKAGL